MSKPVSARLALYALLAAMILRALVPAGWMPSDDPLSSGSYIVICTSGGIKAIQVDGNGVPVERSGERTSSSDGCAFGNTVAFGLAAALPAAAAIASVEAVSAEALQRLDGTSAGFPRARDPPVPA